MQAAPAFDAQDLKKSFGSRPVLNALSLSIPPGQVVGLLGSNGAGKTTLLKALLGLLPIDSGATSIADEDSRSLSPAMRARIGYVPQVSNQFSWLNGRSMLRYVSAFYPAFDWDYTRDLAARWQVSLKTPIGLLSPGQQQRLSIVRALGSRPDLLVFDEPMASLDPSTRLAVIDELMHERERRQISVIFSSHITQDLRRLCTHFMVLTAGRIVMHEPVKHCEQLICLVLEGEETALSSLATESSILVRRGRNGERRVVMDRAALTQWSERLPPSVQIRETRDDLDAVLAEWMV